MTNTKELRLHLIRHAETEWQSPTGKDYDRCINEEGKLHAQMLGMFLKKSQLNNPVCYCSAAQRTRQTLEQLLMHVPFEQINFKEELYLADFLTLFRFISSMTEKVDIVLVGHNNGISDLAHYLTGQNQAMGNCDYLELVFTFDNWACISSNTAVVRNSFRD
jgi:phosphohistidine phosphatase